MRIGFASTPRQKANSVLATQINSEGSWFLFIHASLIIVGVVALADLVGG